MSPPTVTIKLSRSETRATRRRKEGHLPIMEEPLHNFVWPASLLLQGRGGFHGEYGRRSACIHRCEAGERTTLQLSRQVFHLSGLCEEEIHLQVDSIFYLPILHLLK